MIKLELTREEAVKLETYLLITTRFREGEAESFKKRIDLLAEENTSVEIINKTKSNLEFWEKQCVIMDKIQKRIYHALTTPTN